jgi:hypothetical protein
MGFSTRLEGTESDDLTFLYFLSFFYAFYGLLNIAATGQSSSGL